MEKIEGTDENWDNRVLGADERYVRRADPKAEAELDKALGIIREKREESRFRIPGVFANTSNRLDTEKALKSMNEATREWTTQAAKGNCGWICADCCTSFPDGMPDVCAYNDNRCTDIIRRDKALAR